VLKRLKELLERLNPTMYQDRKSIDLLKEFPDLFHGDVTPDSMKELHRFLREHINENIIMYHGTSADFDIENQGLLPTSLKRRNSMQSSSGFVYLSLFPNMAKTFAEMAFPNKKVQVYKVTVPIEDLKPDKDQLFNKRVYCRDSNLGDTLVDSLVHGHGARLKGSIEPYKIVKHY